MAYRIISPRLYTLFLSVLAITVFATPSLSDDFVDFTKDIYIKKNGTICETQEELAARQKGAPADCANMPSSMMVVIMKSDGFLNPDFRIRLMGTGGKILEVWVKRSALTNTPEY